jgi:hypothetical protein
MASAGCLCQLLPQLTDEDIDDFLLRFTSSGESRAREADVGSVPAGAAPRLSRIGAAFLNRIYAGEHLFRHNRASARVK